MPVLPRNAATGTADTGSTMSPKGKLSRLALISAGEQLFVVQGLEVVSLEQIARAAGQRNKSAVQYYFGDRAGLIQAIVDLRYDQAQAERESMLAAHEKSGAATTIRSLVEALVLPVAHSVTASSYFGRFQAQYALMRGPIAASDRVAAIKQSLKSMLQGLEQDAFEVRWALLIDTYVMAVAHVEQLLHAGSGVDVARRMIDDLVSFIVAGIASPASC